MILILFTGVIVAGWICNFMIKPKAASIYQLAKYYLMFVLLTCMSTWLFYFGGIKNALALKLLALILKWGFYIGPLVVGYLTGYLFLSICNEETVSVNDESGKVRRTTLWAISILTASTFLVATVGKLESMSYMISFFKTSGYATWFLYFIMAAEILGAFGILLHFKLKTGPFATAGLMLIMIGAIYTHSHNKDPFSDSYAAVIQFITLSILQLLYYCDHAVMPGPVSFTLTDDKQLSEGAIK